MTKGYDLEYIWKQVRGHHRILVIRRTGTAPDGTRELADRVIEPLRPAEQRLDHQ